MSHTDLNILSSNKEGLSGVTLESLASEKPFIGSDVEGINDIVPDKTFLFRRGDAEELKNKILEISSNKELQQRMVRLGQEHVQQFDIQNMANSYLKFYSEKLEEYGKAV